MVSFLVMQEVWGPPRSQADPGQSPSKGSRGAKPPMKLLFYLKLQGYFGFENDCTYVIEVVVFVVKITIQLTYSIHGFKKKKHTTISLFNGDARTTRICQKQIFRASDVF